MALVSVVIPTYNRGAVVERAIESALAQTWRDLEVIVVDDGSTDDTMRATARLAQADSRVRLLSHPQKRGAQTARNTGIRAARGDWVAFLDSDDVWFAESLEARLGEARRKDVRVVHSECEVFDVGATASRRFGVPPMEGRIYDEVLRRPGPMFQGLLVRKEALVRMAYLDETLTAYQEWDTAIRLAREEEFAFLSTPTFAYDCRRDDSISRNPLRAAVAYERVVTKHRWSILSRLGPRALATHYRTAAGLYRTASSTGEARRCLRIALVWWPFRPKAMRRLLQPFA